MRLPLDRRTVLGLAAAVAASRASAQAMPTIGVLSPFAPPAAAEWHRAFEQGLRELGWAPGSRLRLEYR